MRTEKNIFYTGEEKPAGISWDRGVIDFDGVRGFSTCYSPLKMLDLGIFGHGYFGIKDVPDSEFERILKEIPLFESQMDDNIKGKSLVYPQNFRQNKYGIQAGLFHDSWEANGWIHKDDPYGWFNWYVQFYYGRRHEDDVRQISRFSSFVSRHRGMLLGFCQKSGTPLEKAGEKYQKTCQGLLQWAWDFEVDTKKIK